MTDKPARTLPNESSTLRPFQRDEVDSPDERSAQHAPELSHDISRVPWLGRSDSAAWLSLFRVYVASLGCVPTTDGAECHLPFDQFVMRELGCAADLRYVDDFVPFSDSKRELWRWKAQLVERLVRLRLMIHETVAQVVPVAAGIPGLGFVALIRPTGNPRRARCVAPPGLCVNGWMTTARGGSASAHSTPASEAGSSMSASPNTWGLRKSLLAGLRHGPRGRS